MSQSGVPNDPGAAEEPKRRFFSQKGSDQPGFSDPRIEAMLSASHRMMMERLEEGLEAIEETATSLMREVAGEIWKVAGGNPADFQSAILERLTKDGAVRGLIAHSDERFQSLDVRVARIEGGLDNVDRAAKLLGELMETGKGAGGSDALAYVALEPRLGSIEQALGDVSRVTQELDARLQKGDGFLEINEIRDRLNAVQEYLGALGNYLGDRDRALVDWLRKRTTRIGGPEGDRNVRGLLDDTEQRLKDSVALHVQALHERIERQAGVIAEALAQGLGTLKTLEAGALAREEAQAERLTQGLEALEAGALARVDGQAERLEAVATDVAARVEAMREASDAALERMATVMDQRLTDLTEQIWADGLAMRRDITEHAHDAGREVLHDMDDRLARMSELVSAALGWAVEQIHEHIERETLRSVEIGMADLVAMLDRRFENMDHSVLERVEKIDRVFKAGLGALEESFAERTGEAVDSAIQRTVAPAAAELAIAAQGVKAGIDDVAAMRTDLTYELTALRADIAASVTRSLDDRITQLARLIRSDNKALAERLEVVEQQAAAKEALRAVNELAAAIPGEISEALDERLALIGDLVRKETRSTAGVVAKVGGALADRIDRNTARIGQRFDREVESVVDQIGGTMANIATGLQRAAPRQGD
jgi:hypothetical protein